MVAVVQNWPATIQNDESVRDALKLSKSRSTVLNPSVQQTQFLAQHGSFDTYVYSCEGLHTKEDQTVFAQACLFALLFSVVSSVCMWGVAINW